MPTHYRRRSVRSITSEVYSQQTDESRVRSSASSYLLYCEVALEIQRRKSRQEQGIKDQQKALTIKHEEEQHKLRQETDVQRQRLEEEIKQLVKEVKQKKWMHHEKTQQEKHDMNRRHAEEQRHLETIRQELEFQTEQQLIEAEKIAYECNEGKDAYQITENLLKLTKSDIHIMNSEGLLIQEHEPRVMNSPLSRQPVEINIPKHAHSIQRQKKNDIEDCNTKYNGQSVMNNIIDIMQAPPAEIIIFDGNPLQYHLFMKAFDNAVHTRSIDDCAKLTRLTKYCTGEPKTLVESCMILAPSEGYLRARKLLQKRYGDEYKIAQACVNKITGHQQLKAKDSSALQKYADNLRTCKVTLDALGPASVAEMNTSSNLVQVFENLPEYLKNRWRTEVQHIKLTRKPEFNDMVSFVERVAEEANDPVYGLCANEKIRGTTFTPCLEPTTTSVRSCPACQNNHYIFTCTAFKNMKVTDRLRLANEKMLC